MKNQAVECDAANGDVLLAPLLELIHETSIETSDCMLQYWSEADQAWVLAGRTPLQGDQKISLSDLNGRN